MQPINYLSQVADPFAQSLQGIKIGAGMADLQAQRALAERQQQQQQLAVQEQARFITNPNPTMRDAARYASFLTPEQSKAFLPFMEGISKEQQQNTLKSTGQLLSALQTNPQVFISRAKENALAARNSGDEDEATLFEQMAEAAADPQRGPGVVFKSLTARIAGIPGAKEMFETIDKGLGTARAEAKGPSELKESIAKATEAEVKAANAVATAPDVIAEAKAKSEFEKAKAFKEQVIAKYAERTAVDKIIADAASLGLTKAQTNEVLAKTSKLGIETKQAALQLKALEATGGVDPDKKFTQEEKIRKEYQGRTKSYGELSSTFQKIEASSKAQTGPGDIALITGFMKMLDEGSVVRETEFALARNTAGLFESLKNQAQKLQSGRLFSLDSKQRQEYVDLAKQYLEAAQKKAGEEKVALGVIVKNYKLNPDNVFGPETAEAPPAPAALNPSEQSELDALRARFSGGRR